MNSRISAGLLSLVLAGGQTTVVLAVEPNATQNQDVPTSAAEAPSTEGAATAKPSAGRLGLAQPASEDQPKLEAAAPVGKGAEGPLPKDPYMLFCKSVQMSSYRAAKWLHSMQRPDGLFVYGWIPSLNRPLPEDNYLRQAGAAAAMGRAANFSRDPELAMASSQAVFVLLSSFTEKDEKNPQIRKPTLSPADANPVGFSALLLLAISEQPNPNESLLEQGEQLARFIQSRQRANGSIDVSNSLLEEGEDSTEAISYYPGEALYALMRSYPNKPEAWKLEVVKKAFDFYVQRWREKPMPAFVPWQSSAYTEAFLLTGDRRYAEFVFMMNDWMLQLQYIEPQRTQANMLTGKAATGWLGGFGAYEYGHVVAATPGITTACYAEGLVDACRVAKVAGDQERLRLYRNAVDAAFMFLISNQYASSRMPHFDAWYSAKLSGAFHASVVDGTVRIDYAQHAINAMVQYLTHVVETAPVPTTQPPVRAN